MNKPGIAKYAQASWGSRVLSMGTELARTTAQETIDTYTRLLAEQPSRSRLWKKYIGEARQVLSILEVQK